MCVCVSGAGAPVGVLALGTPKRIVICNCSKRIAVQQPVEEPSGPEPQGNNVRTRRNKHDLWWMRNAPCNTHLRSPPRTERTIPNSRWSWQLGVERVFAIIMASPLHGRCIRGSSIFPPRRSGYGIARRECVQLDLRHIGHRNTMERPITRTTMVASRLGPRSPPPAYQIPKSSEWKRLNWWGEQRLR